MPKITVVYDPHDRSREGKTVEVDDDTAREMIREGRATPAGADKPEKAAKPEKGSA